MKYDFIAYGSLISHNSLSKTIKDRKFIPVVVKGFRRIFNLSLREKGGRDVLNIARDKNSFFNGVMFEINEEELTKLKEREDDYNLEEADFYDFETGKKLGKGLISVDHIVNIDKSHELPDKPYFELCREAAYHLSEKFGKVWDDTTYTSAGEKVSRWIKHQK